MAEAAARAASSAMKLSVDGWLSVFGVIGAGKTTDQRSITRIIQHTLQRGHASSFVDARHAIRKRPGRYRGLPSRSRD